ncbi:MAG TPA: hypothetical protein PLO53_13670, partial [Candidatus Hydrogenedentes bacterium]|nr:hypothetical protein [Candidatus Hydrogenedentota bacterium]
MRFGYRPTYLLGAMLILMGSSGWAEVPVTGTDQKVSLKDLAGTETLVTVVLKDSGAEDKNLKVVSVNPGTVTLV